MRSRGTVGEGAAQGGKAGARHASKTGPSSQTGTRGAFPRNLSTTPTTTTTTHHQGPSRTTRNPHPLSLPHKTLSTHTLEMCTTGWCGRLWGCGGEPSPASAGRKGFKKKSPHNCWRALGCPPHTDPHPTPPQPPPPHDHHHHRHHRHHHHRHHSNNSPTPQPAHQPLPPPGRKAATPGLKCGVWLGRGSKDKLASNTPPADARRGPHGRTAGAHDAHYARA